jgi:hypothetical protein
MAVTKVNPKSDDTDTVKRLCKKVNDLQEVVYLLTLNVVALKKDIAKLKP